jgi:hypothetical protein
VVGNVKKQGLTPMVDPYGDFVTVFRANIPCGLVLRESVSFSKASEEIKNTLTVIIPRLERFRDYTGESFYVP